MQNWYDNIRRSQKLFLYGVSVAFVFVYGVGILPLCLLIYLELGAKERLIPEQEKIPNPPKMGDADYLDWANKEGRWSEENRGSRSTLQ